MDRMHTVPEQSGKLYESMKLEGLVKWFDTKRGYGFVIVAGRPDVLIHLSVLKRDECEVPITGATVTLTCELRPKGLQCIKVHSVNNSTGFIPAETPVSHERKIDPKTLSEWCRVCVKWFNRARGYGFVTTMPRNEHGDIYIHMESLRQMKGFSSHSIIHEGDKFDVRYGKTHKGFSVVEVRAV